MNEEKRAAKMNPWTLAAGVCLNLILLSRYLLLAGLGGWWFLVHWQLLPILGVILSAIGIATHDREKHRARWAGYFFLVVSVLVLSASIGRFGVPFLLEFAR